MKNRLTRGNLLATLKELKKHPRPKVVNPVPASVQAICPQKVKVADKVMDLKATLERRRVMLGKKPFVFPMNTTDRELFERLTTLHDYRLPYDGKPNGELFIHWFYRERSVDRLSTCEIFHLNIMVDLPKLEVITIEMKGFMNSSHFIFESNISSRNS